MAHVFAPAHQSLRVCQSAQFRAQSKGAFKAQSESLQLAQSRCKSARVDLTACCGTSSNLAFEDCLFESADSGRFSDAGYARKRSLLQRIDDNKAGGDATAEQSRQLKVGNQMESAGQPVAGHIPLLGSIRHGDRFDATVAFRAHHARAGPIRSAERLPSVACAFEYLGGMTKQCKAKSGQLRKRRLLINS